ncbi:MAG: lycopene cyclase domain-containing protein [bacterium]
MTYTQGVAVAVALSLTLDLAVLRTRLVTRQVFWASYGIVLGFQLAVNGVLTGLDIVQYDPRRILGPHLVFAPIEDVGFGFALITATLSSWVWLGRRGGRPARGPGRAEPPAADARVPR